MSKPPHAGVYVPIGVSLISLAVGCICAFSQCVGTANPESAQRCHRAIARSAMLPASGRAMGDASGRGACSLLKALLVALNIQGSRWPE